MKKLTTNCLLVLALACSIHPVTAQFTYTISGGEVTITGYTGPAREVVIPGTAHMVNMEQPDERYSRQKDIVPPDRLADCKATVIGVGAIGRQVALQLSAMGIPWLQLVDFDEVEQSNLASQGYLEEDMGELKVNATLRQCRKINAACQIHAIPERFRRSMDVGSVVFCAVDNIETRRLIWHSVKDRVSFYVDGRMTAEVIRVLAACDHASREHYPSSLFAAEEAHAGSCTAKSTIFTANIAAGLMVEQFTRWLRGLPVDTDIQLNLLASELTVTS